MMCVGGGDDKKPLAQGKRPIQVRANIITDGGDHDDNEENNRRGGQNWLWLPTCNIRLMQLKNKRKTTIRQPLGRACYLSF